MPDGLSSTPVNAPPSSAGLMRFFDISGGGPKIAPAVVVAAAATFIVLEVLINVIG